MSLILPTKSRSGALKKNPRILLLYGAPKCGKTEQVSKLENNLILDLENGSDYADQGMFIKVKTWDEIEKVGSEIIKAGRPYKYLTVDTATELENWCDGLGKQLYLNAPSAAAKYKANPDLLASITVLPGEKGAYGPGYLWLRIAYSMCFEYLQTLADTLIMICHVKDKDLVDNQGNEINAAAVHSKSIDLTGKLKAITCGKADSIGRVYRKVVGAENGQPIEELRVNFHGLEIMAGSRPKHLAGKDLKFEWDQIFLEENV